MMVIAGTLALVGIATLIIRLKLIWRNRKHGCDAYYFLLSSEVFKREKKVPIVLPPVYRLEKQEQWYPPGFSMFLSMFPRKTLDEHYWLISPVLDSLLAMLAAVVGYVATGMWPVALVAGLCYALSAASMVDCTSLNSRILGSLLLALTLLSMSMFLLGNTWFLLPAALFGALTLLTHKSSSQLLYFLVAVLAIATKSVMPIVALLAIAATAMVMSRGFMAKVWKGQYDILAFWNRNWRKLGTHPIYNSPAYRDTPLHTEKVHLRGWKGAWKTVSLMGLNAFILPMLWAVPYYASLTTWDRLMFWWVAGTYLMGILTQAVPGLRFAGEGYRYIKLAALPVGYLCAVPLLYQWQPMWVYYCLLVVATVVGVVLIRQLSGWATKDEAHSMPAVSSGLRLVIDYLKADKTVENVLCIPDGVADALGYYTKKPILRGTHNVHFRQVDPFFPVHRLPLEYLVKGHNVSHLVVAAKYTDESLLELGEYEKVVQSEDYALYKIGG